MIEAKRKFPKFKFSRQHTISLCIADFYCHTERLNIEKEGSIDDLDEVKIKDVLRQEDPEDLGLQKIAKSLNP